MLEGKVRGRSQKDLIEQATKEAETYFGFPCVKITLINEEASTNYIENSCLDGTSYEVGYTTFTAEYRVNVEHKISIGRCTVCRKLFF